MSLFTLPTELSAGTRDVTRFYYEINEAQTRIDASNAKQVSMHMFHVLKDGNRFWVPQRSYFKLKCSLKRYGMDQVQATSNRPLLTGDRVAPIKNFPSAMFKAFRFYIGADKVSEIDGNDIALISTLKDRMAKSASWLGTLGLAQAKDSDWRQRQKMFIPPEVRMCRDLEFDPKKVRISLNGMEQTLRPTEVSFHAELEGYDAKIVAGGPLGEVRFSPITGTEDIKNYGPNASILWVALGAALGDGAAVTAQINRLSGVIGKIVQLDGSASLSAQNRFAASRIDAILPYKNNNNSDTDGNYSTKTQIKMVCTPFSKGGIQYDSSVNTGQQIQNKLFFCTLSDEPGAGMECTIDVTAYDDNETPHFIGELFQVGQFFKFSDPSRAEIYEVTQASVPRSWTGTTEVFPTDTSYEYMSSVPTTDTENKSLGTIKYENSDLQAKWEVESNSAATQGMGFERKGKEAQRIRVRVRVHGFCAVKTPTGELLSEMNTNLNQDISFLSGLDWKTHDGAVTREIIYQPPIGIFDIPHALPGGHYRFEIEPQNIGNDEMLCLQIPESLNYNMAGETGGSGWAFRNSNCNNAELGRYKMQIHQMQFYSQTIEGPSAASQANYVLDLTEWKTERHPIISAKANENLYFNVSPTADALVFGLQATNATTGAQARMSVSDMKAFFKDHLKLRQFEIDFAGIVRPLTNEQGQYEGFAATDDYLKLGRGDRFQKENQTKKEVEPTFRNYMVQRYMDSQINMGSWFNQGGSETFQEWLENGPIHVFVWPKDGGSISDRVTIRIQKDTSTDNSGIRGSRDTSSDLTFPYKDEKTSMVLCTRHRGGVRVSVSGNRVVDTEVSRFSVPVAQ